MNKRPLSTAILLTLMITPAFAADDDIYSLPTESVNPQRVPVLGTDFNQAEEKLQAELNSPYANQPLAIDTNKEIGTQTALTVSPNEQVLNQHPETQPPAQQPMQQTEHQQVPN